MMLAETLQPRLSEWRPSGDGRHTWAEVFAEAGWAIHLAADKNDSLSALVWELTLSRTADAPAGLTLRGWAEAIASCISGLMEYLKVLEVDETRGEALLRSEDPSRRGDVVQFYEIRLTGLTRAVVRRFKADTTAGTRREQVPFVVTHEVLAQMVEDIIR